MTFKFHKGQALPAMTFCLRTSAGAVVDLSSGWTATAKYALDANRGTSLANATTPTLAATDPNITISPTLTEFDSLTAADGGTVYAIHIRCTRTADGYTLDFGDPEDPPTFTLFPAVV